MIKHHSKNEQEWLFDASVCVVRRCKWVLGKPACVVGNWKWVSGFRHYAHTLGARVGKIWKDTLQSLSWVNLLEALVNFC